MAKTAIVTGGSRGIGRQTAVKLAEQCDSVFVIYRGNDDAAGATCCEIEEKGATAEAVKLDVTDFAAVQKAVAEIKKKSGTIDVLVNCAGIRMDGILAVMKEEAFDAVVDVNLKGTFNMMRHCVPVMMRQRSGSIINITSVAGITGNSGQANYSASKAGVIGLTKSAARELASRGIRCNGIAPGFVETDMTADLAENGTLLESIPMKRMGKPDEIAELVGFLASEKSGYITGQIISIDGGMNI